MKQQAKLQEKVKTLFATIAASECQEERDHEGQDFPELGEAAQITSQEMAVQG